MPTAACLPATAGRPFPEENGFTSPRDRGEVNFFQEKRQGTGQTWYNKTYSEFSAPSDFLRCTVILTTIPQAMQPEKERSPSVTIPSMLYALLIEPLELFFEMIYSVTYKLVLNPGLSIVFLSLIMNILLLPLYRQTDRIQFEAIETEKKMKPFVAHIRKTFQGDERFMMLQTYYRQVGYKPTDGLKGISPLMLEIPFFMAAYNFLSGLGALQGVSFGPIPDLGKPDGMLVLGGHAINLLPILMTAVNLISSAIYTRGAPAKTKLQLYGMAALFLVLLYDSPAGLAFYWTLNNVFSLVKNALMQTKKPLRAVAVLGSGSSLLCIWHLLTFEEEKHLFFVAAMVLLFAVLNLPLCIYLLGKRKTAGRKQETSLSKPDRKSFFCGCAVLSVLLGLMIPSTVVKTAPEEFISMGQGASVSFLHIFLIFAGAFLIWFGLFYSLARPKWRKYMELGIWILCIGATVDYLFFGRGYGNLNSRLIFDIPISPGAKEMLVNLLVLAAAAGLAVLLFRKKEKLLPFAGITVLIAMVLMSGMNIHHSKSVMAEKLSQLEDRQEQQESLFTLSRTGKNVVVLMMDRAINGYLPFIFEEKPELQRQFEGFTYYPNTLSYGPFTNVGLPSVFGGYEYTPLEMNRRREESLESKHNEALKVLPAIFGENEYRVTVCDPTYAGYDFIPDLSVFEGLPNVEATITRGRYSAVEGTAYDQQDMMTQKFFYYSLMKASPVVLQEQVYNEGGYLSTKRAWGQSCTSNLTAAGVHDDFDFAYGVLDALPQLTGITDEPVNTYQSMCNDTTHCPQLLQLPDYVPAMEVDNTGLDNEIPERMDGEGNRLVLGSLDQITHYHCNAAGYLVIGRWLDFLRENDLYDNTRIIIVSDHGRNLPVKEEWMFGPDSWDNIAAYNPLLLVKDFGSREFTVDEQFMTNADVPALALSGLVHNPVNPFTGKPLNSEQKNLQTQYVFASLQSDVETNHGNVFNPDPWLAVNGDMKNADHWQYITQDQLP